jgi:hypothetical protein
VLFTVASGLGKTSGAYSREVCYAPNYYYQAFQIDITLSGTYAFSSNSSIDTYGYLYKEAFEPANPIRNKITHDNDGCGNKQFWLQSFLQTNITYILVVTTFGENQSGSFSIQALGGASFMMTHWRKYHWHRMLRQLRPSTMKQHL